MNCLGEESRGSVSLTYIYSSMAALGLSLLAYNFSYYMSAQSAAEEAARAAARCLGPTDGECILASINPGDPGATVTSWYGYDATDADVQASTDLYDYSAEMYKRTTNASYNSYDIHWDEPLAYWDEVTVPLQSFKIALNQYMDAFGTMVLPTNEEETTFSPATQGQPYKIFPPNALTDNIFNHLNVSQMISQQANYGNNVIWQNIAVSGGWTQLPAEGDSANFSSGWITVPTLENTDPEQAHVPAHVCQMNNGDHCNQRVNEHSGDNLQNQNWHRWARIAFIPMSRVRNTGSSSTSVSWTHHDPDKPGLKLIVKPAELPDGSQPPNWSYCLGGRRDSSFSADSTTWFNMDIRGPAGSNDGERGVCPESNGIGDFDSIRVPRGAQFRIVGTMRREDSNVAGNELEVRVRFLVTMDDYNHTTQLTPGPAITCPNVQFSTSLGQPRCDQIDLGTCAGWAPQYQPDYNACASPAWTAYYSWNPLIPTCTNDGHAFVVTPQMRPFDEMYGPTNVAMCSGSWTPPTSMYPTPPTDSIQCGGWIAEPAGPGFTQVAALSGGCPLATTTGREFNCENRVPHGNPVSLSQCDGLSENGVNEAAVEAATVALNASQQGLPGAPTFDTNLEVFMEDDPNSYWEFSWSDAFEGETLTSPLQIRPANGVNPKELPEQYEEVRWQKTDGTYESVPLQSFYPDIQTHAGFQSDAYGWSDLSAWTSQVSETVQIDDVWPFVTAEGPQPRPYHDEIPQLGMFDYDLNCLAEEVCGDSYPSYTNLESALRNLAGVSGAGVPSTDESLRFVFAETYALTDIRDNVEQGTYPDCSQHLTQCTTAQEDLVFLGVGEEEPESCSDGTHINCYSETSTENFTPGETFGEIQTALAQAKAMDEVQRLVPYASACSGGPGCTAIEITDDGERARIQVSIEAHVSAPLSQILGAESITVSASQEVPLEIAHVGG